VEEFNPSRLGYENLLVVEAFLSDGDENFTVRLSRSVPIDTTSFIPESGADILLLSADNEQYELYESDAGIYTSFSVINPRAGKDYKLQIRTSDGRQYESEFVTMRITPPIDSVTFAFEEKPSAGLKGMQVYVNSHDPSNNSWYYRWEWEEHWIFRTPFYSSIFWENGEVVQQEENINTCWLNGHSDNVYIGTTKNLSKDIVSKYPLHYVTTESDRLSNKYSLNVKQYSLSEESYNYWKELEKSTENLGTLFDPQPSTVQGNIYNINDETEVVLGYFDAASVEEKRVFISRGDLPPTSLPNVYNWCEDSTVSYNQIEEMMHYGYSLYTETVDQFGSTVYVMANSKYCVDCTLRGSNIRPDFWE
jgi:hypothetical protein